MILLNFSHPITGAQRAQIESTLGQAFAEVRDLPVQFDHTRSFADQVAALVDSIGLTTVDWQTLPILINPPAFALIAVTLLAELHGRMGYFPPVVRLRPMAGSLPPAFEVAEIVNLQSVRDAARLRRGPNET